MLKSILDYANELESTAESTSVFLEELKKGRKQLNKKIIDAKSKVALAKNPDKLVKSILPKIKEDILKTAVDILQGQILVAIRDNYEYDWPDFRRALFLATEDKDTYKIYELGGTGWSTRLTFTINLDATAGRLEAWARGVKLTRKDLGTKVPRKGSKKRETTALQASRAWAGIFGARNAASKSKYSSTIKSRLSYSGRIAPFWQLLDKGTIPMPSDRGGYPTPKGKPTNFVQNAQQVMEEYTKNVLTQYKKQYDSLVEEYYKYEEEFDLALARMDSLIYKIKLDLKVIEKIKQEYYKDSKYIDNIKLERAVSAIIEGFLTEGRVEITMAGATKRIRPSVKKIKKIAGILY